ncbi:colanic acid biosynthesis glycosyltransferase WcaL [Persicimonas caeni]|uniref:Colanic acid biosynthesis glycosyltransferase WcaL n=1 Tax=Persicimonas caeni TaxID=2292766 RepID=A0A4Y6Q3J4_PERCE|nr:glycosyltransferase [Persicimonas caeni]QDG54565.1 colanic acid biosynthesis glycosyltransferase WcaL [Persicimonas caeni]QED35786.1 colanic acid biosynthesis glycosyltransferase WcaL [Persicimonas caeni]
MRIAFVTGKFPQLSQTFILQQITGLIDLGADVEIFASPVVDTVMHRAFQHYDLGAKTHYRPEIPPAGLGRWRRMLAHLRGHSRRAQFDTLRALNKCGASRLEISPLPGYFLPQLIDAGPFDVIHCHFGDYGRYASALRRLGYDTKVITTFHGYGANVYPRQQGADSYRSMFRWGDLFTVNSQFLKRRLIELGCPAERIRVLPMGVDLSSFEYREPTHEPGEPVRLVSVARLVPAKGLSYAIRAVRELVDRGFDVVYRIAGGGELEAELQALIDELDLGGRVELLGPKTHDEVRELYADSDIFVLPSVRTARGDEETQGVVVQEAHATGLPVVVTDIGGISEGMIHGETGYVCTSRDATALADALAKLIEREQDWRKMSRRARALVEGRYDLQKLNRALLALYEEAISSA